MTTFLQGWCSLPISYHLSLITYTLSLITHYLYLITHTLPAADLTAHRQDSVGVGRVTQGGARGLAATSTGRELIVSAAIRAPPPVGVGGIHDAPGDRATVDQVSVAVYTRRLATELRLIR